MSDFQEAPSNMKEDARFLRLKNAVENAGGNAQVAGASGIAVSTLSSYMNGAEWKFGVAKKIAEACGVGLQWLMFGDLEQKDRPLEVQSTIATTPDDLAYIDYYNIAASAGFGLCADEAENPEKVAISKRFLRQDLGLEPNRAIMLETRGDSMEPALRAGDRLVVDTRQQRILDGVHVLVVNGGLLVKRVSAEPDGKVRIASDNPLYPPFFTDISRVRWGKPDGDSTITVIGRVAYRLQAMS
ncbi:XRE family transcriptional regulator [Komagataeibacter medellinensis]|uniref:XRE family transcriptional regulator n=1 Tax=Komagataeibacter medellinensis TaxID=1177712 RepID=A0ABQ6VSG3_9PROT|nr:XRE family transcriptional regulator [Komagataeibacter medellinensis]KAB8123061.1 XRE family transcriptional regulator [Komagataeibacter medellinensis]